MESEIKVIDYLIENGGCDCCAKCAYYKTAAENSDAEPCKEFERRVNKKCLSKLGVYK